MVIDDLFYDLVTQVESGFCLKSWDLGERVTKIQWNPNPSHQVIAAAAGKNVFVLATGTGKWLGYGITTLVIT